MKRFLIQTAVVCAGVLLSGAMADAQYMRLRGLSVAPAYEGWRPLADGTFEIIFGYMNSNWEEEFDLPVGPDNHFEPGNADRGQPTHFYPRRNRYVFRVHVPKDFGKQELVWTLTTNGKTLKAYGSLTPDYLLNDISMESDNGSLSGATITTPEIRMNTAPQIEAVGDSIRTVKVGETLVLASHAIDDGLPPTRERGNRNIGSRLAEEAGVQDLRLVPPRQVTQSSAVGGLWVSLIKYRGPGNVDIEPAQIKTWEDTRPSANSPWAPRWVPPPAPGDGKWQVTVKFDQPGEYVLRWHASDGGLYTDTDVKVTVTK
ncbi:MAG TPA: hypothetical protein VEF06_08175 [Bryobacteraceae bacterium]|nr:hypothetical protein [Bryobacteraceae bacterium]